MDGALAPSILTGNVVGFALLLFSWVLVLPKGRASEFYYLALGNTLFEVGIGLYLTERWTVPALSIAFSNGSMLSGIILIARALEVHAGWSRWRRWEWPLVIVSVALMVVFSQPFFDNLSVRTTLFALCALFGLARMLAVVARGLPEDWREQPLLLTIFGGVLTVLAAVIAARIVLSWGAGPSSGIEGSAALSYIVSLAALLTLTLCFVSLVHRRNQRLLEETLATRDRLLSLIAHDLRGPTGAVANLLEMLRDGLIPADEREAFHRTGAESARNASDLLENLLDWALSRQRTIAVQPEPLSLEAIAAQASGPLLSIAHSKSISLVVQIETGTQLWADAKTVTSILRNLLSNALKFTPAGGTVTLEGFSQEERTLLKVRDSGIGIPEETLSRLNRDAVLESRPGTKGECGSGLGLSLSREFLQANSGTWSFTSGPAGTEVTLSFPRRESVHHRLGV